MKKNIKIGVLLFTVFAVSMIGKFCYMAVFASVSAFSRNEPISISVETGDSAEPVELWYSAERGIFFLPAYAELKNCSFVYDDTELKLCLDGKIVRSKKRLKNFNIDHEYVFSLSAKDNGDIVLELPIIFMKSENLSAVYLTTESGTLDYVHEDKENREAATMKIVDAAGKVVFQDEIEALKGHGNTTWEEEKRPYMIKLRQEKALLGMHSGKKWILFANAFDASYIRNSFTLELAEAAGMKYTPSAHYIDLYINHEYKGNYQLAEKIEIGDDRIAIKDLEKENKKVNSTNYKENERFGAEDDIVKGIDGMNNPKDITGGYLLERNYGRKYRNKVSGFITDEKEKFVVRSPSYASKEEIAYIRNVIQSVENAIYSSDGIDEITGLYYTDLIDLDSFVQKYLLEEIVLNEASGATSSWFYKPENEISTKVFAGPAWDYDKALTNHDSYKNPRVLSKLYCYQSFYQCTKWFCELYKKEEFTAQVKNNYEQIFRVCLEWMLSERMDEYKEEIRSSVRMDQMRWHGCEGDFETEIDKIKNWMEERIAFLDEVWIEGQEVYLIRYLDDNGHICGLESVPVNETLQQIPNAEKEDKKFLYWIDDEEKIFDEKQLITEDLTLWAAYEEE